MAAALPAVLLGLFGLLIGSFLNVVIYRVPLRKSIVSPPSACPNCQAGIRRRDNVPVLSWLLLRGRCRDCAAPISARYPVVELCTGIVFAAVALRFWSASGQREPTSAADVAVRVLELAAFLYLAAISVALTLIDVDTHTLPNRMVLPAYVVGAALLGAAGTLGGGGAAVVRTLVGAVALLLLYAILAFAYRGGMGLGDVKLAGVLGLFLGYLGWAPLAVGAFAAFLLGGLFSIVLLVLRRANRKSGIPFGPWMLGGAWVGVFFGAPVALQYLSVFGLR